MTGTIYAETVGDGAAAASTVASATGEECDASCFFCTGPETD